MNSEPLDSDPVANPWASPGASPPERGPATHLAPHRGTMVLIFGILGLICCIIFGIVAWVLGNSDLREMREGRMDPSGEGMTLAGKVCGIISIVMAVLTLGLYGVMIIIGIALDS